MKLAAAGGMLLLLSFIWDLTCLHECCSTWLGLRGVAGVHVWFSTGSQFMCGSALNQSWIWDIMKVRNGSLSSCSFPSPSLLSYFCHLKWDENILLAEQTLEGLHPLASRLGQHQCHPALSFPSLDLKDSARGRRGQVAAMLLCHSFIFTRRGRGGDVTAPTVPPPQKILAMGLSMTVVVLCCYSRVTCITIEGYNDVSLYQKGAHLFKLLGGFIRE